jgi:AcrR family transcriptional regulator
MAGSKKREDILKAALKLIVEHDLDQTSMDMIAKEAKVGMGTIYNYFPSKEDLINQLYRELQGQLLDAIVKDYSEEAPIRERFFATVRNKFYFYLKHPDAAQFLEQYAYSPIISQDASESAWKVWQIPIQIMEQGRQQQIVKDLPTYVLILLTSSAIYNLVKEHQNGNIHLDDQLIAATIAACWDAIKL